MLPSLLGGILSGFFFFFSDDILLCSPGPGCSHFIMGIRLGIFEYLCTSVISLHGHGLALLRSLTKVDYRIPRVVRNPDTRVVHIVRLKPYGGIFGIAAR